LRRAWLWGGLQYDPGAVCCFSSHWFGVSGGMGALLLLMCGGIESADWMSRACLQ
jgi:hypothetical protein